MSDYTQLPIGTVVVEVRTYIRTGWLDQGGDWVRQHTGERVQDGWIQGLLVDQIGTVVRPGLTFTEQEADL